MDTPKTAPQETLDAQITAYLSMFTDMMKMNDPALLKDPVSDMVDGRSQFMVTVDMGCGNTSAAVSSLANPTNKELTNF